MKNVFKDPTLMAKVHAFLTVGWIALIVPTVLWWKDSILWVALMSIWANVSTHWSAFQAARSEQKGGR